MAKVLLLHARLMLRNTLTQEQLTVTCAEVWVEILLWFNKIPKARYVLSSPCKDEIMEGVISWDITRQENFTKEE